MNQNYDQIAVNAFRNGLQLVTDITEAPERKRKENELFELQKSNAQLRNEQLRGGLADAEYQRKRRTVTDSQADELHGLRVEDYERQRSREARQDRNRDAQEQRDQWYFEQKRLASKRQDEIRELESVLPTAERIRNGERVSEQEMGRLRKALSAFDVDYDQLRDREFFGHVQNWNKFKETGMFEQSTLDALNHILRPSINRNIGNKGRDGTPIVSSEIVSAGLKRGGDDTPSDQSGIVWKLRVKTKGGDDYLAPITVNRSSKDDDPVEVTSFLDLDNQINGRTQIARALQGENAYREVMAGIRERGGSVRPGGSESANVQYAKYVAQAKFGGDQAAALDWIKQSKGKSPHEMAIELTKIDLNRNKFGNVTAADKQRLYQENLKIAQQMVSASSPAASHAAGGGDGQAQPPADPDAIIDELIGGGA